jgi:hypothetical protein
MFTPLRVALAVAVTLIFGMAPGAAAQKVERAAKNVVYVETLGNAVVLSVNYERMMRNYLAVRVGVNALGVVIHEDGASTLIVPVMLTYLSGLGSSRAEFSLGARFAAGDLDVGRADMDLDGVYPTATLGYRFQPREGGFVARAGFTPVLSGDGVWPWIGFSFGYAF